MMDGDHEPSLPLEGNDNGEEHANLLPRQSGTDDENDSSTKPQKNETTTTKKTIAHHRRNVSKPDVPWYYRFLFVTSVTLNAVFLVALISIFLYLSTISKGNNKITTLPGSTTTKSTTITNHNSTEATVEIINNGDHSVLSASKPGVIYGHVHMPKTAGSEINGELASHWERVCGHKGYSHDAFQFNKREQMLPEPRNVKDDTGDVINKYKGHFNRGRVPFNIMVEEGFEDCDYISLEVGASKWVDVAGSLPVNVLPLELHIPCREDPVDHLMSMCNYKQISFDCLSPNIAHEIEKCLLGMNRFDKRLFRADSDFELRCFQPIPIQPYVNYMGGRLQRKRIENEYVHRASYSAEPRHKDEECIWKPYYQEILQSVKDILLKKYDYFSWCQQCIGSKRDLLFNLTIQKDGP